MEFKSIILSVFTLLSTHAVTAVAGSIKSVEANQPGNNRIVQKYGKALADIRTSIDSAYASRNYTSIFDSNSTLGTYASYTLFTPFTFYHSAADGLFGLDEVAQNGNDEHTASYVNTVREALIDAYLTHPELVLNSQERISKSVPTAVKTEPQIVKAQTSMVKEAGVKAADPQDIPVDALVVKPNFWTFNGDYYLQFIQNFISTNWYKGGESSYSMVGAATFQANYNNKSKLKLENKLEMKLGFQTSETDSLHKLKTSEDLLRYTGKLGLQASKKWYYTLQLIAYTQFMRGFKNNDPFTYSDFMSPFNTNLSLGMTYTIDWFDGKLKGTLNLSPASYNFRYVSRLNLAKHYGMKENTHVMHDIGSQLTLDFLWKFNSVVSWQNRLYAYTTYKRTEIEWENTFTFALTKYISSKIFIYPRFDDSALRKDGKSYWQFKEFASLGFAYSF